MSSLDPGVLMIAIICLAVVLVVCLVLGRRIDAKVGAIHFELNPNGGKTMRDAIDRLETESSARSKRLARVESTQRAQGASLAKQSEAIEHLASALKSEDSATD